MINDKTTEKRTRAQKETARKNGAQGGRPGSFTKVDYIEQTHQYFKNGVEIPGVSKILDSIGFKGFYKTKKGEQTAADRGTDIHKIMADYYNGEIVTEYIGQIKKANAMLSQIGYEVFSHEVKGCRLSPDVAGTADAFMINGKDFAIGDWKSGQVQARHLFQMVLYCYIFNAPKAYLFYVDLDKYIVVESDRKLARTMLSWYNSQKTFKGVTYE